MGVADVTKEFLKAILPEEAIAMLRRLRHKPVVSAPALTASPDELEKYKRLHAEMGAIMGTLRDERDHYKLEWEAASAELRRPAKIQPSVTDNKPIPMNAGKGKLRIICVGTGRDGTTSVSRIIQDVFDQRGQKEVAKHEWCSAELNALFCDWKETGDDRIKEKIRQLFLTCPYECIVGNGHAAVMPIIAETLGDQVVIVHLRRRDRAACVASLVENATLQPVNHLYYANSSDAVSKRPAAFHFDEMPKVQWNTLPIAEKFGWYYDKTHALIEQYKPLFSKTMAVDTEDLDDEAARAALARIAGSDVIPQAFHLNRFVDLRHVPEERRSYVQRLLGTLNVSKLADDDLYGLRHVLNEFVYQMNHFPDATPAHLDELRWTLEEASSLLESRLNDIQEIRKRVGPAKRAAA